MNLNCNRIAEQRRDQVDELCWQVIDRHVPATRPSAYRSIRPSNYAELEESVRAYKPASREVEPMLWTWPGFEYAWSDFLHEFFHWRLADFFSVQPPAGFPTEYRALLAGAAEILCRRYDLDLPDWIDDSQYILPTLRGLWPDLDEMASLRRVQRADPAFLKRNLIFEARNLIVL